MTELAGTFMTKVFDGPFSQIGKWSAAMHAYAKAQGVTLAKIYYFYATCPKCAKRYGKNQVVLFGQMLQPAS